MKKATFAVFVSVLFLTAIVPQAHAALLASQEDSSGTPSHYWHSDGTTGAYLVLDPNDGGPGYSIGSLTATTSSVIGIHIKAEFVSSTGVLNTLPTIPHLFDESGNTAYVCAQLPYQGYAYPTAADAMNLTNPLQYADWNGKMVDMYFQCATGTGHDQVAANTSYRLYFYPVSTADVSDMYIAMNAAGTEPYYEISVDGTL